MEKALRLALREFCKRLFYAGRILGSSDMKRYLWGFQVGWAQATTAWRLELDSLAHKMSDE